MRTIECFEDYVDPIQEAIDDLLFPTLFGQTVSLPSDLRQLVALTPAQGGLSVPDLRCEAPQQFAASTSITAPQVHSITTQSMFLVAGENSTKELKRQHQALKSASVKLRMESTDSALTSDLLPSVNQSRDKGASSCLTRQVCLWWEVYRLPCPVMQKGRVRGAETRWCSQPTYLTYW